ncbi:MAG: hypothetical protein LBT27_08260 [Prevotellaceae bacterium]|jgi:hypothetical protein|nr:hypothetical protein [Prevotellaceae bacterium]
MKKNVVIFMLIVISGKIAAQTETPQLSLPDTSKFMLDVKPQSPVNINFNIHKNPFPTTLTIQHEDLYSSKNDSTKQELLNEQNINPNLLFVRSVYFSGESPLFSGTGKNKDFKNGVKAVVPLPFEIKQDFRPLVDSRYQFNMFTHKWETVIIPRSLKIGKFTIGGMAGGIGVSTGIGISTKEERLKRRAEKRKTYVY